MVYGVVHQENPQIPDNPSIPDSHAHIIIILLCIINIPWFEGIL